jgi:hypothetical protein
MHHTLLLPVHSLLSSLLLNNSMYKFFALPAAFSFVEIVRVERAALYTHYLNKKSVRGA